jgi:hypothetical protein
LQSVESQRVNDKRLAMYSKCVEKWHRNPKAPKDSLMNQTVENQALDEIF